jgi:CDP-glucose 4,6-dehydratase
MKPELNGTLNGQKALITGGNGFMATNLKIALVERGISQIIVTVRNPRVHNNEDPFSNDEIIQECGPLEDAEFLKRIIRKHSPDNVYHLAAQTEVLRALKEPFETLEANIRGTYNLLEACRLHHSIKSIIVMATDKVYGDLSRFELPYVEYYPPSATDFCIYGASKMCADFLAQVYAHRYHLPIRILRPANTYGPYQKNFTTLISATIKRILDGEQPTYREGMDQVYREYLYVKDLVEAIILLAEDAARNGLEDFNLKKWGALAYNVGSGERHTAKQVVEMIIDLMGVEEVEPCVEPVDDREAAFELGSQYLSSEKFKMRFPEWQARPFKDGLKETIHWYLRYLRHPIAQPALQNFLAA